MRTKIRTITELLGSRWIFGATVLIFALETGWLAVTSRFPMAFDETYHLGLIRFFSHYWNPIVSSQPPSSYKLGAIVQNPSWLYHYLMSFPYRLMELFTHNPVALVIGLRFADIGLMVVNLFILRKLLRLVRVSSAMANIVVLVFAFTPLVTLLAAQISYDDLLIPLTTISIYMTVLVIRELDQKSFNSRLFLYLLCLCLLTSLVKFAFLPIFIAIAAIATWKLTVYWRSDRKRLANQAAKSLAKMNTPAKTTLLTVTALSLFLFGWFYGRDIIQYHNPIPQCNQVLSKKDCLQYYSWAINYNVQQITRAHPADAPHLNLFQFTAIDWAFYMSEQLYGAIYPVKGLYYISAPLFSLVLLLFSWSIACAAINSKKIIRNYPELLIFLFISFIYLLFLWGRNYWDLHQLGLPTAINGRYLVPILAYLYVILGLGISYALGRSRPANVIKLGLATIVIVIFIIFGGFFQYITQIAPKYGHISRSNSFVL